MPDALFPRVTEALPTGRAPVPDGAPPGRFTLARDHTAAPPRGLSPGGRAFLLGLAALAAGCRSTHPAGRDAGVVRVVPRSSPSFGPPVPRDDPATLVIPPASGDPCRTDRDCHGAWCFTPEIDAQYSRTFRDCVDARAWRARRRLYTCIRPGCTADRDCPHGQRCADVQMLPFPQRACLPAHCASAMDCRARPRGQCVHYVAGLHCEPGGWACSYESDACAPRDINRRCPAVPGMIASCVPREGRFRCVQQPAPLP